MSLKHLEYPKSIQDKPDLWKVIKNKEWFKKDIDKILSWFWWHNPTYSIPVFEEYRWRKGKDYDHYWFWLTSFEWRHLDFSTHHALKDLYSKRNSVPEEVKIEIQRQIFQLIDNNLPEDNKNFSLNEWQIVEILKLWRFPEKIKLLNQTLLYLENIWQEANIIEDCIKATNDSYYHQYENLLESWNQEAFDKWKNKTIEQYEIRKKEKWKIKQIQEM